MSWSKLPFELRYDILTRLAETESHNGKILTGYAMVASEWQPLFEKVTFKTLRIQASELESFQAMFRVRQRRAYLRKIDLVLELPQHNHLKQKLFGGTRDDRVIGQMAIMARGGDGAKRFLPGLEHQQKQNNMAFTQAMCFLFGQLAMWRREHVHHEGIALEIIADSMSYWQRTETRMRRRAGPVVIHFDGLWEIEPIPVSPLTWGRYLEAAKSDFHFSLDLDYRAARLLPRVQVITSLIISRRSIRHFDPRGISEIMHCLSALTTFIWEVWPRAHRKMKQDFDDRLSKAISNWPSSLNDIRITQLRPLRVHCRPNQYLAELGSGLALRCQLLTRLSINYSIDAFTFFRTITHQCHNLQHLFLRSEKMIIDELPGLNSHLISMAVGAVHRMPRLRFLVLYNTSYSHVGFFNYEVMEDMPILSIRCSWPFEVAKSCLESWQAVVKGGGSAKWCIERLPIRRARFLVLTLTKRE
ncbi:hypothetical protein CEP51_008804 [Fusarium floridanum]|uniref:DUF6546 domain-containing protein n=1 Tax=Fusarium floridanum TaxID=1325733 RepID=A0A428RJQ6_9HYPO|nr:hypothetical protein CEP51_008804 [Fusarium floridanum]